MSLIFSLNSNMIYFLPMLLDLDHFFLDKTVFFFSDQYHYRFILPLIMNIPPKCSPFLRSYCTVAPELLIWHWIRLQCKGVAVLISDPSHIFHLYQCLFIFALPVTLKPNNKAGRSGLAHPSISTDISSSPGLWHSTILLNNEWISAVLSSAQMVLTNIDPE